MVSEAIQGYAGAYSPTIKITKADGFGLEFESTTGLNLKFKIPAIPKLFLT